MLGRGISATICLAAIAAICTLGPASSGSASTPSEAPIVLGNVGNYSGVYAPNTIPARDALYAWEKYTNAHGGLQGHPVKIISMDDGGDPSQNLTDVQTMVEQDHVIAFVDDQTILTLQGSLDYLTQHHIPVIGGNTTQPQWFSNPWLFPQNTETVQAYNANAKLATATAGRQLGILYCAEVAECSSVKQALTSSAKADHLTVAYTGSFSLSSTSFTAQCIQAKQAGVKAMLVIGAPSNLVSVAASCAQQGFNPKWTGTLDSTMVDNANLQGAVEAVDDFPWVDSFTPAQRLFQTEMKRYYPTVQPSSYTASSWAAAELMTAASKYVSATPTTAELLKGLWSIKKDTLGGIAPPLTFNTKAPASPTTCYYAIEIKNNHFVDPYHGKYQC